MDLILTLIVNSINITILVPPCTVSIAKLTVLALHCSYLTEFLKYWYRGPSSKDPDLISLGTEILKFPHEIRICSQN